MCVCVCVTMPAVEEVHYIAVCRHLASACLCVRDVKEGHTLVLVLSAFLRAKDLPIDFFQPSCVCETAKKSTHRSARFFQPSCVRTTGGFGPNERRVSSPSLTAVSALMCEWCVRARVCERRQRDTHHREDTPLAFFGECGVYGRLEIRLGGDCMSDASVRVWSLAFTSHTGNAAGARKSSQRKTLRETQRTPQAQPTHANPSRAQSAASRRTPFQHRPHTTKHARATPLTANAQTFTRRNSSTLKSSLSHTHASSHEHQQRASTNSTRLGAC